jgi:hypothetical protein
MLYIPPFLPFVIIGVILGFVGALTMALKGTLNLSDRYKRIIWIAGLVICIIGMITIAFGIFIYMYPDMLPSFP